MRWLGVIAATALAFVGCRCGSSSTATAQPDASSVAPSNSKGLCHGAWCWEDPLPTGDELADVAPDGKNRALFVTRGTMASSFIVWDREKGFTATDVAQHVTALYRVGPNDVLATTREGVVLRGDGVSFKALSTGVTTPLLSIWGTSATDVWAVGESGTILHFDGEKWENVPSPTTAKLHIVRGQSAENVWIGGEGVILQFQKKEWRVAQTIDVGPLKQAAPDATGFSGSLATLEAARGEAITRVSALFVADGHVMAAAPGRLFHFDGKNWSEGSVAAADMTLVSALGGTSAKDVWAIGNGGIGHFNGTAWTFEKREPREYLHSIHVAGTEVWAVGVLGAIAHYDGARWTSLTQGSGSQVFSVHVGTSSAWASGDHDTILRRDTGGTWTKQSVPAANKRILAIGGANDSDLWAFRPAAHPLHWDGQAWTDAAGPILAVNTLRAAAPNDVWAIGQTDSSHWDGTTWTRFVDSFQILDLWAPKPGEAWAVGRRRNTDGAFEAKTTLMHFDGKTWSASADVNKGTGIGGTGSDLWIAGLEDVERWDGSKLVPMPGAPKVKDVAPRSVLVRSKDEVWITSRGHAARWDGKAWTEEDTPIVNASFASGPHGLFAFGSYGGIARRR